MYYNQKVSENHPNLVLKSSCFKNLDEVDTLNMSGVEGGRESEQVKLGLDVISAITYKSNFVVNAYPVTLLLDLG